LRHHGSKKRVGLGLRPGAQAVGGQRPVGKRSVLLVNRLRQRAGHGEERALQLPRVTAQQEIHAMFLACGENLHGRFRKDPAVHHYAKLRPKEGKPLACGLLQVGARKGAQALQAGLVGRGQLKRQVHALLLALGQRGRVNRRPTLADDALKQPPAQRRRHQNIDIE